VGLGFWEGGGSLMGPKGDEKDPAFIAAQCSILNMRNGPKDSGARPMEGGGGGLICVGAGAVAWGVGTDNFSGEGGWGGGSFCGGSCWKEGGGWGCGGYPLTTGNWELKTGGEE